VALHTDETDLATAPKQVVRRRWPWLVAAGVAGSAVVVAVWFQPQKLFIDDRVDEDVPTAQPLPPGATGDPRAADDPGTVVIDEPASVSGAPAQPVDLAAGEFVSLDHGTSGTVRVLGLADGRQFVRFEDFETSNGPAVYVYLSTNPAGGPEGAFDDEYLDLGSLRGNVGDQNYELPADLDLSRYASVVVWCDRFDSAFGAADLSPGRQ
jgi:hypothetical protein